MSKIYTPLFILLLVLVDCLASDAQIIISSSDMPNTNNVIRVSNGQAFPGLNVRLTGADYSWNYSQLAPVSQTVDTFVSVLSTGLFYAAQFYGNSSYALKSNTPTVTLAGALTIDYEYDFYKESTSAYVQTGFGANINSFPLPVPYNPVDTIYRFPLHYYDTGLSSSSFSVLIPGLGYYGGDKTRIDTVDGWGMLTTPYGTFPVLRVKSEIHETDTIYSDAFMYGFIFPRPVLIEYKWLGTNQRIPLLQINTSAGVVTQILYRDSLRINPLAVAQTDHPDFNFHVYPNPVAGNLVIEYNLSKEAEVTAEIFNSAGEEIISASHGKRHPGNQFFSLNLGGKNIPAGIYFVRLNVDGNSFRTQKIIVE